MNTITKDILQSKVDYLNSIKRKNDFIYGLYYAYGGVQVVRCYKEGGQSDVSPRGTKREIAYYLDVMISAILWDK